MRAVISVLFFFAAGCASHDRFCELTTAHCVESCGGAPFIQCGVCPDGSIPVEDCGDGGLTD